MIKYTIFLFFYSQIDAPFLLILFYLPYDYPSIQPLYTPQFLAASSSQLTQPPTCVLSANLNLLYMISSPKSMIKITNNVLNCTNSCSNPLITASHYIFLFCTFCSLISPRSTPVNCLHYVHSNLFTNLLFDTLS